MSLVIRKYNAVNGWPIWISVDDSQDIEPVDITNIDSIVNTAFENNKNLITNNPNNVKILAERIREHVDKSLLHPSGIAVVIYVDKMFAVSGSGTLDKPTTAFREMVFLLNVAPHV